MRATSEGGAVPWTLFGLGAAGLGVNSLVSIEAPLVMGRVIDVDLPAADREGLYLHVGAFVALVAVGWVASLGSQIALEIAAQQALLGLKRRLFDHLVNHDVAFHDEVPSGSLIGRVQGDVDALRVLLVEVLLALPADLVLLVGMLVVLLVRAQVVAMPILLVVPLFGFLFAVFRTVSPPVFLRQRARVAELTATLTETYRALPALRPLARDTWAEARANTLVDRTAWAEVLMHWQTIWFHNAAQGLRALATLGLLVWGAVQIDRGNATVGLVVVGLAYLRQVFAPLMRVSMHLATLERARASAVRLADLLDRQRTVRDPALPEAWTGLREGLRLEGVSFHYPSVAEGPAALVGLDVRVPAGARIGIVGPTGAGKSTLVDLVLRFRDPTVGRVAVDGVDLRAFTVDTLRAHTALVLQDVRTQPGTVLDNLGGDRPAAERALAALGLELPLDRYVDDGSLSKGERQLLVFARAMVRDPALLVLDEATSAIDPATEARVQRALDALARGRTVLIVAHRLETVRACDAIWVLRDGTIVEIGTHDELLARGGLYAALVRLQVAA